MYLYQFIWFAGTLFGLSSVVVSDQAIVKYAVDLSYKPYIDQSNTLPLLAHNVASVDLTGSMLGDDRFLNVCDALLNDSSKPPTLLQLKAQMNRLSASCATRLFKILTVRDGAATSRDNLAMLELDLGFNPLLVNTDETTARRSNTSDSAQKRFHAALCALIGSKDYCPATLGLDCTGIEPSTCRAIAKGIIQRFALVPNEEEDKGSTLNQENEPPHPISLRLARNLGIGDPGVAALAAAIRTVVRKSPCTVVLDTLDLSSCNVGDTGAEALAMAFDTTAGRNAIRRLVIGQNRIGNLGLSALCRAFPPSTLVLDGNDQITDLGMSAIADLICGGKYTGDTSLPAISKLSLRSCSLKASGAERIGAALRRLVSTDLQLELSLDIDLSGNPLGILRGKAKSDSRYSASRIKSTVSATANAYMSQGLKLLKKGLGSTLESDDEEERESR
jgi:Leucine Rich repeat